MPLNTHIPGHKRKHSALDVLIALVTLTAFVLLFFAVRSSVASADTASTSTADSGGAGFQATPATVPGMRAKLAADGRTAIAPEGAPQAVKDAIAAANKITRKPYIYGGGHATFKKISKGYDCSSTISYALGNAGMLKGTPLNSVGFFTWGLPGKGAWVTVYTKTSHAYVMIAGLRLDTSGPGERGPRWRPVNRSSAGFKARHPEGF